MSGRGKLLNVGPKSSAWLRQVGIRTPEDLREAGAVEAFLKVKRAGFRPSLNLLYSLEGALTGCHWQQIPAERRGEMVLAVDAAESLIPDPRGPAAAVIERDPEQFEASRNEAEGETDLGLDRIIDEEPDAPERDSD